MIQSNATNSICFLFTRYINGWPAKVASGHLRYLFAALVTALARLSIGV